MNIGKVRRLRRENERLRDQLAEAQRIIANQVVQLEVTEELAEQRRVERNAAQDAARIARAKLCRSTSEETNS